MSSGHLPVALAPSRRQSGLLVAFQRPVERRRPKGSLVAPPRLRVVGLFGQELSLAEQRLLLALTVVA